MHAELHSGNLEGTGHIGGLDMIFKMGCDVRHELNLLRVDSNGLFL
jgi:hypothetical protein